jgi:hypothetical protein
MKKLAVKTVFLSILLLGISAMAQKDSDRGGDGGGTVSAAANDARPGSISDPRLPLPNRDDIMEGFDDVANLPGWGFQNNSDSPNGDWFQGNDTVFAAHAGATTAYIAANFNSTAGTQISNWLLSPEVNLGAVDSFSFWTRTVTGNTFPDRMQVRVSTSGASSNVGTGVNDVGDFTDMLVDINPTLATGGYPDVWTQFSFDASDFAAFAGSTGRIAFRYYVPTSAGPTGNNSNYIGLDTVDLTEVNCAITSMSATAISGSTVSVTLYGNCPAGVDILANGSIVASGVVVNGSTTVTVPFIADAVYAASFNGNILATSGQTVPTLGEWGLIAFMLLLMGTGVFFMRRQRLA